MTPTERKGMWFGLLGVTMFAVTLPVTRLAVGTPDDPHLSGVFLAMGRAVVAACLSLLYLWFTRAAWPSREQWKEQCERLKADQANIKIELLEKDAEIARLEAKISQMGRENEDLKKKRLFL